jgi:L-tyrosine isonitrile desaturase/decarboxylase
MNLAVSVVENYRVTHLKPFGVVVEPLSSNTDVNVLSIEALRGLFREEALIVLRGFKTFDSSNEFANYCEAWGEISVWPFGKVLELVERENAEDHIFDNNYVPLHWDGMYRKQVPEYQIFHCVNAPLAGQGGRTTFSNTMLALKNAAPELKELWSKVTGTYERKMEFYNSKTVSPIITKHPFRKFPVIRYNEPPDASKGKFLNPPALKFGGISKRYLDLFHRSLNEALYAPANFYAHEWQKGDIVIADNFSLLHGREGFVSKAPRHIQRVHVLSDPPLDNPGLQAYQ